MWQSAAPTALPWSTRKVPQTAAPGPWAHVVHPPQCPRFPAGTREQILAMPEQPLNCHERLAPARCKELAPKMCMAAWLLACSRALGECMELALGACVVARLQACSRALGECAELAHGACVVTRLRACSRALVPCPVPQSPRGKEPSQ